MLEDIIRRAALNASTQFRNLSYIANNVSNYKTSAYKSKNFETYLDENGNVAGTERNDASKGAMLSSNNPLDLAIDGPGYFVVTKQDGSTGYTRDGRFIVNAKGYLSTMSGAILGNGIQVPVNYHKIYFDKDGTVKLREKETDDPKVIGKISIVNFANPAGLKEAGGNIQLPTESSGDPELVENPTYINQFKTEMSNLNLWDSISAVMRTNGSYVASLRIIKYTDEMYRQSVNLRQ